MVGYKRTTGFTIVELLIVIVVIAILASITIVAYNGITERARMTSATAHAAQLKRLYINNASYWNFDECSGTTVNSTGGTTANGTIIGTATWSNDTPSGTGCSLSFNGATRIPVAAPISDTFYIKAAWVKLTSCVGSNNIISRGDGATTPDTPFYASNCVLKAGHQGNYNLVVSPNTLALNKWYFVAVEYNNGTMRLFEDGKVVATSTGVVAPTLTANPGVTIGAHTGGNFINGFIDDPIVISAQP